LRKTTRRNLCTPQSLYSTGHECWNGSTLDDRYITTAGNNELVENHTKKKHHATNIPCQSKKKKEGKK
jgi:hypothetical protein